jgi:hypothetical protein
MKAMKKGDKSNVMKTFADGSAAFGLAQPGFEIDGDLLEDEVDEVLGGAQQEDELGIAELVALGEKEYKKQRKTLGVAQQQQVDEARATVAQAQEQFKTQKELCTSLEAKGELPSPPSTSFRPVLLPPC